MILKIVLGKGARGLLNYVSQASKSAHHPQQTHKRGEPKQHTSPTFSNFAGTTPRQIAAEFAALRLLKPNLSRAAGHLILSPDPADRALTKVEWQHALQLALQGHGAIGAPYAAYLHSDTELQHLHVFFSRILPNGQVISDSQSYQKNRTAARKIEKELQMETLNSTPAPDAPGDRQAAASASKRDERLGLKALDQAEIRTALAESKDLAEIELKLQRLGIEVEFSRRGVKQEVFGWKLRRAGNSNWSKASTLAKDLSWPSIKHRFENTPASTHKPTTDDFLSSQPTQPIQAAQQLQTSQVVASAKKKEQREADAEEMADASGLTANGNPSPKTIAARQYRDQQHQRRMQLARDKVTSSKFAKALLLLGEAISHFLIETMVRFFEWVRDWLLRKLGLSVSQHVISGPNGRQRVEMQPDTDKIIEVEAKLIEPQSEPLLLDYRLSQAAEFAEQATRAVNEKKFENIPGLGSEGRTELVAELQKTIEPVQLEPVAEFPYAVAEKLNELEKCLVQHRRAAAAATEEIEKAHTSASWEEMQEIQGELDELEIVNSAWLRQHSFQASFGANGPNANAIKLKTAELEKARLKDEADSAKRQAKAAPQIKALEADEVTAVAAVKAANSAFYQSAAQSRAFDDDPRLGLLPAEVPQRVQVLVQSVTKHLSGLHQPDIRSQIKSVRESLNDWDQAAKTPLPRAHKPLLKDEQKEKPDDDQFEVPR